MLNFPLGLWGHTEMVWILALWPPGHLTSAQNSLTFWSSDSSPIKCELLAESTSWSSYKDSKSKFTMWGQGLDPNSRGAGGRSHLSSVFFPFSIPFSSQYWGVLHFLFSSGIDNNKSFYGCSSYCQHHAPTPLGIMLTWWQTLCLQCGVSQLQPLIVPLHS